jgi:hypothetical protein
MADLIRHEQSREDGESGTNVGRFLAKRGLLLMKESREIGTVKCDYGKKIAISSLLISAASSASSRGETNFGIRVEESDEYGQVQGGAFLDFDELAEFIGALSFVDNIAKQMLQQQRDYTEITYSTKDNVRFGFYQSHGQQQGFLDIKGYGDSVFLSIDKLQTAKQLVETARKYLLSRGAQE